MKHKEVYGIFIRYVIILAVALPNLWLFYFVFTPLTVYPVYFLLNFFFDVSLIRNFIIVSGHAVEIIKACVAGSAYYLLLILNLSVPKIKSIQRIKMVFMSFASLLLINILRIFVIVLLFISGSVWFDLFHKLFWYFLSIVFVLGIWFAEVKIFKIKTIPFYSDIKYIYKTYIR